MQMFLAGAGNAAVIMVPQPCLDRVHGYQGSRQEINQDPRFLSVFLKHFKKIFIFGCAGSLLLCGFFSSCGEWGLLCSCGARASHFGGISYCGAQAPGLHGLR